MRNRRLRAGVLAAAVTGCAIWLTVEPVTTQLVPRGLRIFDLSLAP